MGLTTGRERLIVAFALLLLVALGWFAYSPALSGAFYFDDLSNLGGLALVDDAYSALNFIFSGIAGPLGRPLALASFVPQAADWGGAARPFLQVNVLIHLANSMLVALFFLQLSKLIGMPRGLALFASVGATAIWMFMPLLASATLMVVQRMATLSATFVLAALVAYLFARRRIDRYPVGAFAGMSSSIVVGGLLAALTKESGVLLVALLLVIEVTLLSPPARVTQRTWRIWIGVFLVLPTAAIIAYLISLLPYDPTVVLRRGFTAAERLQTEAGVLWQYLANAFVPQPSQLGPFQEGYPVARSLLDPLTLLAVIGWAAVILTVIRLRRRLKLFAFAVFWFLGCHLVESTTVPIELYFEHRNYLAMLGPIYALCATVVHVPDNKRKLFYIGVPLYAVLMLIVLVGQTTLWGSPAQAAQFWYAKSPYSVRAAMTFAQYQLVDVSPQRGMEVMRDYIEKNPQHAYLRVQELNLQCVFLPQYDHGSTAQRVREVLSHVDFSISAGVMLSELFATVSDGQCRGVGPQTVRDLAIALMTNDRYKNVVHHRQQHYQLLALFARSEGDTAETIRQLQRAIQLAPTSRLNMMMVTTLVEAGEFSMAREFIASAREDGPWHPVKALLWEHDLDELGNYVDEVEKYMQSSGNEKPGGQD
ncbi:MAG: hypothetical protein HKP32_07450 [Woeseia sp.]|nr:hypothetical protein [Woeseia sp.]